jgi:hypothetical protein
MQRIAPGTHAERTEEGRRNPVGLDSGGMFRRRQEEVAAAEVEGIAPRRPHAGMLRREQKALLRARDAKLRDLGGLVVEMYRRGAFREDLLEEACADAVGIDARLAEIDDLLHGERHAPRCECGVPILRGSHFCPNCGRALAPGGNGTEEA